MMNNNKILTVSYGTFSCTLEGFEDSFDTMKAIAEYFRDLAADDRYFGAEPPQPDAEMLARIAEREVSRRVEAHEHEGRIMLKAHEEPSQEQPAAAPMAALAAGTAAAATPEPAPAEQTQAYSAPYTDTPVPPAAPVHPEATSYPAPADAVEAAPAADLDAAPAAPEMEAPEAEEPVAEMPIADDADETAADEETALDETIAAPELQETVVEAPAQEEVAEETGTDLAEETEGYEDSAAAFFADSPMVEEVLEENEAAEAISVEAFTGYISAAEAEAVEHPVEEAHAGDHDQNVAQDDSAAVEVDEEEFVAETAEDVTVADDTETDEVPVAPDAEAENDLEKAETADADEATEEFVAEDVAPESAPVFAESFADKLQRIRAVVSRQDEETQDTGYEEDMDAPAAMSDFEPMEAFAGAADEAAGQEEDASSAEAAVVAEAAQDIEDALTLDDEAEAAFETVNADDLDAILSRIDSASNEAEDTDTAESDQTDDEIDTDNIFGLVNELETEAEDDDDAADGDVQGRILKVNRSELDAALEAGELEEYEDESLADAPALTAAEEAQLHKELAAFEDDADDVATDEDSDLAEENLDDDQKPAARESLPEIDETAGKDVSRLMAEADQQMNEPEGKTRRSAFAHLRAAVAARFADKSMDRDEKSAEEETEAYRSDLAEVVKPRRPVNATARSDRPANARPAPLKLVAEQRIDHEQRDDGVSVAPRRVAAAMAEELELSEDTGFALYAEERGATTLPEVLEAAAAYLCHVEGLEEFSRPQLMARVKQADCGEFSREDGLRSFGQLLRTGKIEKIKGGRFVASDAIGFKPGHRAVG